MFFSKFRQKVRARWDCPRLSTLFLVFSFLLITSPEAWAAPYSETKIILEVNSTDGDAGIQIFLDGDEWTELEITDPDGHRILEVETDGNVGLTGITELFFESSEPSFDELPLSELLERFPEGKYLFEGVNTDGKPLKGKAILTHAIPIGPNILSPGEGDIVNPLDVVIFWDPVEDPYPGTSLPVEIVRYQVIVEREEPSLLVFSVDLPASVTQVTVPWEFLEPGASYKLEVLAIDKGGNQTITESEFETP